MISAVSALEGLRPQALQELRSTVAEEADGVRKALEDWQPQRELCGAGAMWVGGTRSGISVVYVLTAQARDAIFSNEGDQAPWILWNPSSWGAEVRHPRARSVDPRRAKQLSSAKRALKTHGMSSGDAERMLYELIAADVGASPPTARLTPDFMMFVSEHEVTDLDIERVATYAPADAVAFYTSRDLLRLPDDDFPV